MCHMCNKFFLIVFNYLCKFCINSSKNISINNSKNHVIISEAHSILKYIIDNINIDIKNHCLKLDKT